MANQFYERYWAGNEDKLSDFLLKWPTLAPFIPRTPGITILDFGCGKGHILSAIGVPNPGAHLIGLDVSENALATARKAVPGAAFHRIDDGGPFPLPDASVDFVFSSEVIEHVYDTENAFREIARVLRLGGRLLLTTPYHGLIKNLLIVLFGFDRHFNPGGAHVRFFTKKSLFNLLKKHHFEIIKHGYYGRFYPISHSIFVLANKTTN